MDVRYFDLHSLIYTARYQESIIILDGKNNRYFSLMGSAAKLLETICSSPFTFENGSYKTFPEKELNNEKLNNWIQNFIENGFILPSSRNGRSIAPPPIKGGGLLNYQWARKSDWKSLGKSSPLSVAQALKQLIQVHHSMEKKGIKSIIELIKGSDRDNLHVPTEKQVENLSAAVDAAALLYPKKTYCLAWAATFTLLALKKGWRCHFVIGVQTTPFYTHYWAEIAGKIVRDNPDVQDVLSIILKEPSSLL